MTQHTCNNIRVHGVSAVFFGHPNAGKYKITKWQNTEPVDNQYSLLDRHWHVHSLIRKASILGTDSGISLRNDVYRRMGLENSFVKSLVDPPKPEDAASAVILATTRGIPEVYYPPSQFLPALVLVRHICPWLPVRAL